MGEDLPTVKRPDLNVAEIALGKAMPQGRVPRDLPELVANADPALAHSAGRIAWAFRSRSTRRK